MIPLPAPPADPLHVLPPASLLALMALVGLALIAFLLLAWWLLRRRRHRSIAEPPPVPPTPVSEPVPAASIDTAIEAIERQFLRSKAFRDGCHALAAAVKRHLERATGLGVEEMTGSEIEQAFAKGVRVGGPRLGARIGGPVLGRFMTGLSTRRYGRKEPRRRHFVAACEEARELLS